MATPDKVRICEEFPIAAVARREYNKAATTPNCQETEMNIQEERKRIDLTQMAGDDRE